MGDGYVVGAIWDYGCGSGGLVEVKNQMKNFLAARWNGGAAGAFELLAFWLCELVEFSAEMTKKPQPKNEPKKKREMGSQQRRTNIPSSRGFLGFEYGYSGHPVSVNHRSRKFLGVFYDRAPSTFGDSELWRANTCVKWTAILNGEGAGVLVFVYVCVYFRCRLNFRWGRGLPLERLRRQPKQNECASIYLRGNRILKPLKCF